MNRSILLASASHFPGRFVLEGTWLRCNRCSGKTRDPAKHVNGQGCLYRLNVSQVRAAIGAAKSLGLAPCNGYHHVIRGAGIPLTAVRTTPMRGDDGSPGKTLWAPDWSVALSFLRGPREWVFFLLKEVCADAELQTQVRAVKALAGRRIGLYSWARQLIRRKRSLAHDREIDPEPTFY